MSLPQLVFRYELSTLFLIVVTWSASTIIIKIIKLTSAMHKLYLKELVGWLLDALLSSKACPNPCEHQTS